LRARKLPRIPIVAQLEDEPAPSPCGNGIVDAGESCEGDEDCGFTSRCAGACACEPLDPPPEGRSQVLVDEDYRGGAIDRFTWLLDRAYALYGDPRLPKRYDGTGTWEEDLGLYVDLLEAVPGLSPGQQAALEPFTVRPTDPRSVFSQGYLPEAPIALQRSPRARAVDGAGPPARRAACKSSH
jgi:hypothetical protein